VSETATAQAPLTIAEIASRMGEVIAAAKLAKFRLSRPTNIWASFAGHPCDRFKYHCIEDWQDRLPPRAGLQELFDQGRVEEAASRRDIEEAGFQITRAEDPLLIQVRGSHRRIISGKMDFCVTGGFLGRREVPAEHKGLSYGGDTRHATWRDMLTAKQVWVRQYPAQMQLYMLMAGFEEGLLALRGKESGQITWLPIEFDADYCESILQSAERVYDALDAGTPPSRMQFCPNTCPTCDFTHICAPETEWVGTPILQDEELERELERRAALKEVVDSYKASDDYLKAKFARVEEPGVWRCGRFEITRKQRKDGVWLTQAKEVESV